MSSDKRNPYMVLTVRCAGAGCTNVRGHANHWFVTSVEEGVFVCRAYSSQISLREHDEPVCGQACAHLRLRGPGPCRTFSGVGS